MALSSEPRQVDPADLYDGDEPGPLPLDNNVRLFRAAHDPPLPQPQRFDFVPPLRPDARSRPDYVATITAALDVLGARLLGLIATVAACALWAFAVYDPEPIRSYAALGFSMTVLLPLVALYFKRG